MQVYSLVTFGEKATGGGAYKFADLFKEKLDFCLNKEDEMDCLVAGANFLLKVGHTTYHFGTQRTNILEILYNATHIM